MLSPTTRAHCPNCGALFRKLLPCCPLDGTPTLPIPPDPQIGRTIGDYRIVALAGERREVRTYRALTPNEREVEVQILLGEYAAVQRHRWRFLDGAQVATQFDHPNVQRILDFGCTSGGLPYAVASPAGGGSLEELIARDAPMSANRVAGMISGILAGLAHVHEADEIHGMLSPDRVLVARDGQREIPRLSGFAGRGQPRDDKLSGAPGYMAPELATGDEIDARADLYAAGVILYEMLAGVPPFEGSQLAVALAQSSRPAPPIAERVPGLIAHTGLQQVAARLMAVDPVDRFATAGDAARALRRAIAVDDA